ncbi:MAG TPA: hypothetical protein PKE06_02435 [Flavilitoribacter sp.]|nr:hypothetical protein [Flavilitoribacter sp.]HMQ87512.1 hypothetical protein [Flavilitoribacter sp.]
MNLLRLPAFIKKAVISAVLFQLAFYGLSQQTDSIRHILHFKGAISATNNGFSFIPSFSLGKPAAIVNLSVGGERFTFEPEFRYALEGKPWSFIFIWRYKLIKNDRFQFTLGTHLPALSFRTSSVIKDGVLQDVIQSQRFFPVFELTPTYTVADNISMGLFYLYGRGADRDLTRNTHFLSFRTHFSDIRISKQTYLKFNPQFFYLKTDEKDGYFVAGGLTLARKDFPISVSTLMNKAIRTNIATKNFDWNISLAYSFGKNYVRI